MTSLPDEGVVARIRAGEPALFEVLMRRYNQRIYRTVRGILRDDADAEDVMQQAYLDAYRHLDQFEGRAKFSTWLTKIAVYAALERVRRRKGTASLDEPVAEGLTKMDTLTSPAPDPEASLMNREAKQLLEDAVTALADDFRAVFMLREVEGLSTAETAETLGLNEDTVKTRLHRARRQMRQYLVDRTGATAAAAFHFNAVRCDRVVANVMKRIGYEISSGSSAFSTALPPTTLT